MVATKVTKKGNVLVLEIPLHPARPSQSGKAMVVASTNGFLSTDVMVDGKPVRVSVNAIVGK